MPSFGIHLVTATKVSEALNLKNVNDFIFGNILPDAFSGYMLLNPPRIIPHKNSHFGNAKEYGTGKTVLPNIDYFRKMYSPQTSFELGFLSHLLTDYFWNKYTLEKYGENCNFEKQHDFGIFNDKLMETNSFLFPKFDEKLYEKTKHIYPLSNDEVKQICDFFESYKQKVKTQDKYKMFSEEELKKLFYESINFIVEQIKNISLNTKDKA